MTRRLPNGTILIEKETPRACDDCGNVRETRPYGPGGTRICYDCAMKDPEGTEKRMLQSWGANN